MRSDRFRLLRAFVPSALLALFGASVVAQAPTEASATKQLLEKIGAVEIPEFDRSKSQEEGYWESFVEQRDAAIDERGKLVLQLYAEAPTHEALPVLLDRHWGDLGMIAGSHERVFEQTGRVLDGDHDARLATVAATARTQACVYMRPFDLDRFNAAWQRLKKVAPDSEDLGDLLYAAAVREPDDEIRLTMLRRLVKEYPDANTAGYAKGKIRQITEIGKKFELRFDDVTTGATIDTADLVGKVVVIDFWATWCGPCIGEMPHLKDLYSEYRDRGVEFVGISLDAPEEGGGKTRLLEFVEKERIPWPQFYQGNGWSSKFSTSWGIASIPTMFVLDKQGRLHSTEARGNLEKLLPKLLEETGGDGEVGGEVGSGGE